jgi:hypothetical protein
LPVPYGFNAYPGEWTRVLADIRGLACDVLVPGHGRPLRDTVHIDRLVAMLEDIRAQVATLASSDMDAAAVTAAVNLDTASHAIAGDDPWLNRWFRDYWKDPIVSSAQREARGEAIVQGSN